MGELSEFKGDALMDRIDEIAYEVSDCGAEGVGGIGDTGVCHPGDMDETFEAALLDLEPGGMSGIIVTDSGCHLIVRTHVHRPTPKWPPPAGSQAASVAAADDTEYRTLHVLLKHEHAARLSSWRDPGGAAIKARSRQDAEDTLTAIRFKVNQAPKADQIRVFMQLAKTESDSGNASPGRHCHFENGCHDRKITVQIPKEGQPMTANDRVE